MGGWGLYGKAGLSREKTTGRMKYKKIKFMDLENLGGTKEDDSQDHLDFENPGKNTSCNLYGQEKIIFQKEAPHLRGRSVASPATGKT